MEPKVYLALLHYPVYNKRDEVITTSITNLDIHDIARSAHTYDIEQLFLIHPAEAQQRLAEDILHYWQHGYGATYNADRKEALSIVKIRSTLQDAVEDIRAACGKSPVIITTDARIFPNTISYHKLRLEMENAEAPYLVLFGTGWGIERELMQSFDYILEPIIGRGDYNHLSVRAAAAIILDRLLGGKWW
jgi:hypothetical protein